MDKLILLTGNNQKTDRAPTSGLLGKYVDVCDSSRLNFQLQILMKNTLPILLKNKYGKHADEVEQQLLNSLGALDELTDAEIISKLNGSNPNDWERDLEKYYRLWAQARKRNLHRYKVEYKIYPTS